MLSFANYPKESIQHTEHGESLKLRKTDSCLANVFGFNKGEFDDDMDLLMYEKEQLPIEDLVELDKESREEAEEEGTEEDD